MSERDSSPPPVNDPLTHEFLTHLATDRGASDYTHRNYREALAEFRRWHVAERQRQPAWSPRSAGWRRCCASTWSTAPGC